MILCFVTAAELLLQTLQDDKKNQYKILHNKLNQVIPHSRLRHGLNPIPSFTRVSIFSSEAAI